MEKLGVKEVIKINGVECDHSMDQLALDTTIIECKETCPLDIDGKPTITREGNNYTRGSRSCAAAMDFFKDKPDELAKKKFGVRKVPNKENKAEFFFTFDQILLDEAPKFDVKEEVDIMDGENC